MENFKEENHINNPDKIVEDIKGIEDSNQKKSLIGELYRETERDLILFLQNKFPEGNPENFQDAVENVFLYFVSKPSVFEDFNQESKVLTWLNTCVHRQYLRLLNRENSEREKIGMIKDSSTKVNYSSKDEGLEKILKDEEIERLTNAVEKLPNGNKKEVVRLAIKNKPYKEIAKELGIPDGTVKRIMWEVKRDLKRILTE